MKSTKISKNYYDESRQTRNCQIDSWNCMPQIDNMKEKRYIYVEMDFVFMFF